MRLFRGLDHGTYNFFQFSTRSVVPWLQDLARPLVFLGSYWFVTGIVLAAAFFALRKAKQRAALVILVVYLAGIAMTAGLNLATQRQRPHDAVDTLGPDSMVASFPAGPVLLSTFAWLVLGMALEGWASRKRTLLGIYGLVAVMIALVCLLQLVLSLHYLTDILAGLAGGGALALVTRHVAKKTGISY
jgi:undecaprenyl-diphosphatase